MTEALSIVLVRKGLIEMMGLLNLGSLVFGLIAWGLPIMTFGIKDQARSNRIFLFSLLSFVACIIALYMQILYNDHLIRIEDFSALLDITIGVRLLSGVLIITTIILNILSFQKYCKLNIK